MRRLRLSALVLAVLCATVEGAGAACATPQEVLLLGKAVDTSLRCRQRALSDPNPGCSDGTPPACGQAEHDAIVDLIFAEAPSSAVFSRTPEADCQGAVAAAARKYVRARSLTLAAGQRRAPRSRLVRRVVRRCEGAGVIDEETGRLPAIGDVCGELVAGPDLDEGRLAACLSARLEAILGAASPVPVRPNVVLLITDDQRADSLGFMPSTLEEIAGRGVCFENAFVSTASCGPSRATIYSGRYAHNHGVLEIAYLLVGDHDYDHHDNLATWLHSAGYRTGLFGHYMPWAQVLGEQKPPAWDEWWALVSTDAEGYRMSVNGPWRDFDSATYLTDLIAREGSRFIREHREEPFFLVLGTTAPHAPAIPAPRHEGLFADLPPWRPPNFREPDLTQKPFWVQAARFFSAPSPDPVDALHIGAAESLQAVDEAVARISTQLDDLGLSDRTLFLMISDNGIQRNEHWWDSKFSSYEESIRVPLLLRYPVRYPTARSEAALVSNVDIAATIVDAAAATAPPMDGTSLLAVLDGTVPPPEEVLIENFLSLVVEPNAAVRTDRWKYIRTDDDVGITEELYDLASDPYELVNLAADPAHQALREQLSDRLDVLSAE